MEIEIKITGCIVVYKNDFSVLKEAIDSFLNTKLNVLLILIDNSPTDEIKRWITDSRIVYIHNPSNPGFGAAHNIAINSAKKLRSRYHLVLNPDVHFKSGTLEKIVEFMDLNSQVGNLMPKVFYPNGSIQYLCKLLPNPYDWIGRRFNPIKKVVDRRNNFFELRFSGYDKIMEVPYLSGCFMFLNMEVIEKVGVFDENMFMYCEDTDLCRRIISKGYKCIYFPEADIFHGFEKGSYKSFNLTWIHIKSSIYYFNKWGWFFDKERIRINKNVLEKFK
jgi:GT2 family glycosyltransferase